MNKELKDIVKAYDEAVLQGKQAALATVVQVEGSSYRRPGARMLVTEDGQLTGAISGGCLEGDALRKARLAILQQQNRLVVYDTTDDDDLKFGVQLGCNGIVSILFEPIKKEAADNPIRLLQKVVAQRKDGLLVTVFGKEGHHIGTCGYICADETIWEIDDAAIKADALHCLQSGSSTIKQYGGDTALYQAVSPAIQLVVAGAGNDVQPVVDIAWRLGWETIVVDGRPSHATAQRFPKANSVTVSKADKALQQINLDAQTAVVLMTHNYHYDIALLEQLLVEPCSYIGLLGPKKKLQRMLDELAEKGIAVNEEQLRKIHGPVGLDIGADAAEEIALSILAGIKADFAGRSGAPLKFRTGGIYQGL